MRLHWTSVWLMALGLAAPASVAASNSAQQGEAEIAHNTGRALLQEGHFDMAVEQFEKAISLDDKNYYSYKGLGIALTQLKKYKEAEKAQRKCLDLNPDYADVHNDLGVTLLLMGKRDAARQEWLAALASPFNPTPDQTAWNLGNSFLDEGNYAEARKWFQSSTQRNGTFVPALVGLAATLEAQNRADEAVVFLQKVQKDHREIAKNADLAVALGDAYFKLGRFSEARAQLDDVIKKDSSSNAGKRATEMLKHFPK